MTEKSFATCFDKGCEQFAEVLMTLVSKDDRICNIKTSREEFKKDRSIVSGEYVLTIGEKSSAVQRANFPDKYNAYGIHIGFYGHKAWISCESYDWNRKSLLDFQIELRKILKELGMPTDAIDKDVKELSDKKNKAKKKANSNPDVATIVLESLAEATWGLSGMSKLVKSIQKIADNLWNKSARRKQQYKLAVVLFFHKYIKEFLDIKETDTEQNF